MSPAFIWANTWPWDSVGGVVDGVGVAIGDGGDGVEVLDGGGVVVVPVGVDGWDELWEPCELVVDEEGDVDDDELLLDDDDDGLLCELLDDGCVLDEVEELCWLVVDDEEEPCELLEEELLLCGLEPVDDWDELWEPVDDEEDDDDDELLLCELALCIMLITSLRNCE